MQKEKTVRLQAETEYVCNGSVYTQEAIFTAFSIFRILSCCPALKQATDRAVGYPPSQKLLEEWTTPFRTLNTALNRQKTEETEGINSQYLQGSSRVLNSLALRGHIRLLKNLKLCT
jgi:hypothetical protein